jgi:hypothetical protein
LIIDIRTHVISLIAIFLALGVGMFVGTVMLGGDTILKAQDEMVSRLEADVDGLIKEAKRAGEEVVALEKEIKAKERLDEQVISLVLDRKFEEHRTLLLALRSEFEDEALAIASLSNGSAILFSNGSCPNGEALGSLIRKVLAREPFDPTDCDDLAYAIESASLVGFPLEWSASEKFDLLLLSSGLVTLSEVGRDFLIETSNIATGMDCILVIVSTSDSLFSFEITPLRDVGISSVDCIDLPVGRLALALIADGVPGNLNAIPGPEASVSGGGR